MIVRGNSVQPLTFGPGVWTEIDNINPLYREQLSGQRADRASSRDQLGRTSGNRLLCELHWVRILGPERLSLGRWAFSWRPASEIYRQNTVRENHNGGIAAVSRLAARGGLRTAPDRQSGPDNS